MKKSAKLSLTLALMMGITGGVQLMDTNTASAEISDKFRLELNGVTSYFHDDGGNYYGEQTRVDNTKTGKGWNNYTRVMMTYYIDKDTRAVARLHSDYDNAGDFVKNNNQNNAGKTGAYFDQSYLQWNDKKNDLHYIIGKKGMTLGQSMVYNSTGNLTGAQISWGNWYDDRCLQLTYGDAKGGNRVWSAQLTGKTSKATALNATYLRGEIPYQKGTNWIRETDSFVDFGGKVKFHGVTMVGEWAKQLDSQPQTGSINNKDWKAANRGWFVEFFTGPTNDFGSGLPLQKVGTHVFSVRYQDLGERGSYVHNNTFYNDKKGIRFDYGVVVKKGLSVDFVYGRMKDKGTSYERRNSYYSSKKGDWSNIYVLALNYKFR
ncbi:MAG: hypothetical protein PUB57_02755 [Selenomonadaceae bacterium]|nr:hypothetical protein [Selenomonadaceae bacterium]